MPVKTSVAPHCWPTASCLLPLSQSGSKSKGCTSTNTSGAACARCSAIPLQSCKSTHIRFSPGQLCHEQQAGCSGVSTVGPADRTCGCPCMLVYKDYICISHRYAYWLNAAAAAKPDRDRSDMCEKHTCGACTNEAVTLCRSKRSGSEALPAMNSCKKGASSRFRTASRMQFSSHAIACGRCGEEYVESGRGGTTDAGRSAVVALHQGQPN